MGRQIITGIDIGSSVIRVVAAEKTLDGKINFIAAGKKQSSGIKQGYIYNVDEAAKSIREAVRAAEKTAGVGLKKALVSAGGISLESTRAKCSAVISKADGEVTDYDVKRIISQCENGLSNMANRRVLHCPPLWFKVDNTIVNNKPQGIKGSKLETEVLFVTYLSQHLGDLEKTVETAGFSIEDIIPSPLAISAAVLNNQEKEVGCAAVDIGASTVSIVVWENGKPISLETFPIGSTHITNDIALGFQLSLADAERLKLNFGEDVPVSRKKLSDIVEARLNDIFELIDNHLKKINRKGMLPGGIIMAGGGANLLDIAEAAKSALRLPAKVGSISENSSLNITASATIRETIFNDQSWSTAAGLCIMGADDSLQFQKPDTGAVIKTIKRFFKQLAP